MFLWKDKWERIPPQIEKNNCVSIYFCIKKLPPNLAVLTNKHFLPHKDSESGIQKQLSWLVQPLCLSSCCTNMSAVSCKGLMGLEDPLPTWLMYLLGKSLHWLPHWLLGEGLISSSHGADWVCLWHGKLPQREKFERRTEREKLQCLSWPSIRRHTPSFLQYLLITSKWLNSAHTQGKGN